jgi:hypothetical protein
MKNNEDPRLLAHKRRIDAQRKAAAIARIESAKAEQQRQNIAAMHRLAPKGGK